MAACCLHNLLRTRKPGLSNHLVDREDPETHEVTPGAWRQEEQLMGLDNMRRGNNSTQAAKQQREALKEYFVSEAGSVPWQDRMVAIP